VTVTGNSRKVKGSQASSTVKVGAGKWGTQPPGQGLQGVLPSVSLWVTAPQFLLAHTSAQLGPSTLHKFSDSDWEPEWGSSFLSQGTSLGSR
jgi:hypothetical protein